MAFASKENVQSYHFISNRIIYKCHCVDFTFVYHSYLNFPKVSASPTLSTIIFIEKSKQISAISSFSQKWAVSP